MAEFSGAQIELIADYACHTGEGPLYHPGEDRVYWTDIPNGKLFVYDRKTGQHRVCFEGEPVGGFTIQDDGALLLFQRGGAVRVWQDGRGYGATIIDELPGEETTRFNDVFADTAGRVFCGTMPTPEGRKGRLYRLNTDTTMDLLLEEIGCSNGMGFTPDRTKLYYTDTSAREIYRFDYDAATGAITNREVFVTVSDAPGEGYPDGMTVDADGNIWGARWGGGCLVCHSGEDGRELGRIAIPGVKDVSCVTFGGPDYDEMYVTTASGHNKGEGTENAGALFRVKVSGVRGVPEYVSRVRVGG
jgi:D-xylonolactonase